MPDWEPIRAALHSAGIDVEGAEPRPVSGGDISAAWRLDSAAGGVFLKTGPASSYEMFAAEAEGLSELARANAVRVPAVIALGEHRDSAFVALEWLRFESIGRASERRLGEQLAALHRTTKPRYGWHRDNTIGLTPQNNAWSDSWVDFFREHRLGYQLELAAGNGFTGALQTEGARLLKRLPVFYEHYTPVASLLHGDLWGGNWASCDGQPVIFDPAVYYGDRETDLAMTRLFGGFGKAFYDAYESSWPLQPGHRQRSDLYQLYHVLNHLNLFGSGYLGRAMALIEGLR
jgi:protein-ribulosamine 3-kinase